MRINKLFKLMAVSALTMTALTGCGNSSSNGDVKEVAIIQYVEHTSLNTIKDAFDEQMEALGYKEGDLIQITRVNQADIDEMITVESLTEVKTTFRGQNSGTSQSHGNYIQATEK